MAAISDSSPLIVYGRVGRFDLLHSVFDEIFVPPAVQLEVVDRGRGRPGSRELSTASWISVRQLDTSLLADRLEKRLGRGESEAIALALQLSDHAPLLVDDGNGRRIAESLGLEVVGSAGVLIRAKEYGRIPEVRPILDELLAVGLRMGSSATSRILQIARED